MKTQACLILYITAASIITGCSTLSKPEKSLLSWSNGSDKYNLSEDQSLEPEKFVIGFAEEEYKSLQKDIKILINKFQSQNIGISTPYDLDSLIEIEKIYSNEIKTSPRQLVWVELSSEQLNEIITKENKLLVNSFQKTSNHPWDKAHWYAENMLAKSTNRFIVEPNFKVNRLPDQKIKKEEERRNIPTPEPEVKDQVVGVKNAVTLTDPSPVWSSGEPLWHKGTNYSQLDLAREEVKDIEEDIKIAHLDTGYNPSDSLKPKNLDEKGSYDFTKIDDCRLQADKTYKGDPSQKPSHGQRTLSVLAGPEIKLPNEPGVVRILGGDNLSTIYSYKIADWSVVHFYPTNMSQAIRCAADNKVDIISMSAGGFPSIEQRNAVNYAYEKGVAIFAATADFFRIPIVDVKILGTNSGFPALYSNVMGVGGITHDGKSYGDDPSYWKIFSSWSIRENLYDWMLRGSYGPLAAVKDERAGGLGYRGTMVSGFGPNITDSFNVSKDTSYIRQNAGGASATTPQAAAAGALWLRKYKKHIKASGDDHTWKQAEAVYTAMLDAAEKHQSDYDISTKKQGVGPVKALSMLEIEYKQPSISNKRTARIGFAWLISSLHSSGLFTGGKQSLYRYDMIATELEQLIYRKQYKLEEWNSFMNCSSDIACSSVEIKEFLRGLNEKYDNQMSETLKELIKRL